MRKITMYGVDVELKDERADLIEGKWEEERLSHMLNNIYPGMTVFDIGAEEGDMSVMMALKGAKMVLFEPSPSMWPKIRNNFVRNGQTPLAYFAGFASSKTELIPTGGTNFKDADKDGWPECAYDDELDVRSFRHLLEETSATPQITLDDFYEDSGIYPDMLTIDVEGAEYDVLIGAKKILTEHSPLLYVSVHDNLLWQMYGHWFHDLYWDYLMDMGYRPEFLAHNHESHWLFRKTARPADA